MNKKIESALISVYHKEGLDAIATSLINFGIKVYSTGGTATYLRNLGVEVNEVADLTAYPSILEGRVKTLHPKVFGGILARRDSGAHSQDMSEYDIPYIDAVIVDLYPFEETVSSGAAESAIIEKIDIGGISLIRAAAKNFQDVSIVPSQAHYAEFAHLLESQNGEISLEQRKYFAGEAFDISSHYDTQIYQYLSPEGKSFKASSRESKELRYGENPHQSATFFGDLQGMLEQLNGKELSYNNLVDMDAAVQIMDEFTEPCFAILKHTNPCGLATGTTINDAWKRALECDPLSAFGGILITNGEIDKTTAEEIDQIFYEVVIAKSYSPEALAILTKKKARRVLLRKGGKMPSTSVKTVLNGWVSQDRDTLVPDPAIFEYHTDRKPNETEHQDILFGIKAMKHLKSNAIAIVKNGQLIGSGIGQTSRVDALKQAIDKARERGFDPAGSVLASDAFFPFSDSAELAHANSIEVIVEPGGSRKDIDTINFCQEHNMCLVFNKFRHFKH